MVDKYTVTIWWSEDDNCYLAKMPELTGCMADGKTQEEALAMIREVAGVWLDVAAEAGLTIPQPLLKAA